MKCNSKPLLEKKLNEFTWIKELPRNELEQELAAYDMPKIKTTPYDHQLAALLLGLEFDDFMLYLDMGLGKTAVILYLISYLRHHNKIRKALIVVPDIGNIDNWMNETKTHSFLTPVALSGDGTKASKLKALEQDGDVFIINYTGLQVLMTELHRIGGGKKRKRIPVQSMIDNVTSRFDFITFDEIQNAGNPESLVTTLCAELASQCIYRYGLTGTPFGRDLITLWSQFFIVDGGRTFGDSFECFRKTFFNSTVKHFRNASVTDYSVKPQLKPRIKALMASNSIIYDEAECNSLPAQIFTTIPIRLNKISKELYSNLLEEQIAAKNDEEIEFLPLYSKLRQICSGFYYDNVDGKKMSIFLGDSAKIEILINLISEMPINSKMVVFHTFQTTGDLLTQALKKHKIKHVNINHNAEDRPAEIRTFTKNKSFRVALAQYAVASTGLNLQVANYYVGYEPTDRPIIRQQSLKRVHRTGQTKTTYYYDFICKNTIEERVMEFLQEGKSLRKELMSGKANLKKLFGVKKKT